MKCDQVHLLRDPYLDSELDARTTLEIQEHLKSCADCARLFAGEQKLQARLKASLSRGERTARLWEQIEHSVTAAAAPAARRSSSPHPTRPAGGHGLWSVLLNQLQAGWRRSRWAWSGLAAVWVVIFALNFAAREPEQRLVAGEQLPAVSEVRFAVKQKLLLMADLISLSEPAPAIKIAPAVPSPRSDRRKQTLNT
jgi:anti-sigma factor RsiW